MRAVGAVPFGKVLRHLITISASSAVTTTTWRHSYRHPGTREKNEFMYIHQTGTICFETRVGCGPLGCLVVGDSLGHLVVGDYLT